MFNKGSKVLFQGDSITDVNRDRNNPDSMGGGYAMLSAASLLKNEPDKNFLFLNKGISGNRITDLYARWKEDAINLKPDIISILIGINDTWHEFSRGTGLNTEKFERVYKMLLDETKEYLPNVKLILMEPFVLPSNKQAFYEDMLAELRKKQQVIRNLATDYDAIFVDLQSEFEAASRLKSCEYWSLDGVHPTLAGHRLIADKWLLSIK